MIGAEARPLPEEVIDEIIARHPDRTGDVLAILEDVQQRHPLNYLPPQTHECVARKIGVARSQIESVIRFYAFFNLEPQGRHTVTVCRGTACHTRGSRPLLDALRAYVGGGNDDAASGSAGSFTTPDYRLTIRTVACFGQCALAPVVAIDHEIYGHVSDFKLRRLVTEIGGIGHEEHQAPEERRGTA